MKAQSYDVAMNILFQGNQSNIRLMLNGNASSTNRTKYIYVQYFFMTDVIKRGDISMEYCPTGEMWANILTKPVQGQAFRRCAASS